MKIVIVVLTFLSLLAESQGYGSGAPLCVDKPRHGYDPQETDPGLDIKKSITGDVVDIQISSKEPFKGFLLTTLSPGEFVLDEPANALKIECSGLQGSKGREYRAVTHNDPEQKTSLALKFKQAEGSELEPFFSLAIVREFKTFWTNIIV